MSTFPCPHCHQPVTATVIADLSDLLIRQIRTERKLDLILAKENLLMTAQDDIAAAVATDTALIQDLTAQTAAVAAAQALFQQEIEALTAQGVDTSGLVAANAQLSAAQAPLDAAVAALTAAAPAPAAPTAAAEPSPADSMPAADAAPADEPTA